MVYTKQELIDAFCRAAAITPDKLKDVETQIQKDIDGARQEFQTRLDSIPTTAREQMKRVAIEQLAKERAEQDVIDNKGVSL